MDLRVDGTSLNYANGITDTLASTEWTFGNHRIAQVAGIVESQERNPEAQVTAYFHGAGYAMHADTV